MAKKKDMKNSGKMLSMGFGFIEYATKEGAATAIKTLQHVRLDGHVLELKMAKAGAQQQAGEQKVGGVFEGVVVGVSYGCGVTALVAMRVVVSVLCVEHLFLLLRGI